MVEVERETRYYLINDDLYEMIVNFTYMTFGLYKLDKDKSTEVRGISEDIVLSTNLSAANYVSVYDLDEATAHKILFSCMSITRQVLKMKYCANNDSIPIKVIEEYDKAFEKWKEVLSEEVTIKECTLDEVILPPDAKEDILSTINFIKKIDLYKAIGCEVPAGILLEGPPGTGKTSCAKAIAKESNMNFKSIVASDLVQKYVGESAKRINKEFDELAEKGGGVLFIDEIDAIGVQRSSSDENKEYRSAMNSLLSNMSEASCRNIMVICATNLKDQLDPALMREGRIDKVINIPVPDEEGRRKMFELYIGKLKHTNDIDIDELVKLSDGKTGAFIAACCNHSGIYAVDQGCTEVSYKHIKHTINKMLNNRDNKSEKNKPIGFI